MLQGLELDTYRYRFFGCVGHETTYASIGNKHFFTKSCHRKTYQNYEQPQNTTKYPIIYTAHLPNRPNIWNIFKSSDHASIVRALYSAVVEYMYFCCIARPLQNGLFKVDVPPTGGELFQIDVCCEHTHFLKRIKAE